MLVVHGVGRSVVEVKLTPRPRNGRNGAMEPFRQIAVGSYCLDGPVPDRIGKTVHKFIPWISCMATNVRQSPNIV